MNIMSKKYKLTAKEIVHAYENPQYLKDTFKECFETELEVGKWYKNLTFDGSLFFNDGKINGKRYCGYGFDLYGKWYDCYKKGNWAIENEYEPATEKEVEEALVKEAINRGYEKGVKCKFGKIKDERVILSNSFEFVLNQNKLAIGNDIIFHDGDWAEIIQVPTYTIAEAEEKFNIKIKAV